ncbi:VirK/YbjX family protein [Massilia agilis]|uniref:VirK/YbjX family protein n=1 Tax=Massilia agilis TaxID=1811226 RepID=A0ABT2DD76_9BURK|nr:VirK/YbjX family protein [Massilia agilis]MCS0808383.1 VirK/YbjX family protein [Massilia agilis]
MYSYLHPSARERATLKDRVKLLLGAALFPGQTRRWKGYVQDHPVLRDLADGLPRIIHKIYRPYLSNHLSCARRVRVLMNHYTAISEAGLGPLVRRAAAAPVTLARFDGKSGAMLEVSLSAIRNAHREGELALHLSCQGRTVYTASFTLIVHPDERHLALGGLQGLRASDGAAVVRQLTRELHGCRPKTFIVEILRHLGTCLGCSKLILVSNRNRIVVNWRRSDRISADYDTTWREMHALQREDGNFEIPCINPASGDISSVPSHKRSEARKRHALMSQVQQQVAASLRLSRSQAAPFHVPRKMGEAAMAPRKLVGNAEQLPAASATSH